MPHGAAFCPCVLTDLDGFGVDAEYIFRTVYCHCHILADILRKPCRQLTAGIVMSAADQGGEIVFSLMAQTIDPKSTRLNSSHANISYSGFCFKKKKQITPP